MGRIIAAYNLMPEGTDVDLQAIIDTLPSIVPAGVSITETSIKPLAFGLMKIEVGFDIDDSDENVGSKLEDVLRGIAGISDIECFMSTVL
mgnify:CR=1